LICLIQRVINNKIILIKNMKNLEGEIENERKLFKAECLVIPGHSIELVDVAGEKNGSQQG